MKIPKITNLQYFILNFLYIKEPTKNYEILSTLKAEKIKLSRDAFYKVMSRLEKSKLITRKKKDQTNYCITALGLNTRRDAWLFYKKFSF